MFVSPVGPAPHWEKPRNFSDSSLFSPDSHFWGSAQHLSSALAHLLLDPPLKHLNSPTPGQPVSPAPSLLGPPSASFFPHLRTLSSWERLSHVLCLPLPSHPPSLPCCCYFLIGLRAGNHAFWADPFRAHTFPSSPHINHPGIDQRLDRKVSIWVPERSTQSYCQVADRVVVQIRNLVPPAADALCLGTPNLISLLRPPRSSC